MRPLLLCITLAACSGVGSDGSDTDTGASADTAGGLDPDDPCQPWVSEEPAEGYAAVAGLDDEAFRSALEAEATEARWCRWVDGTCRGADGFAYTVFSQGVGAGGLAVYFDGFGTLVAVADYTETACPDGLATRTVWYGERLTACTLETLGEAVGPCDRTCDREDEAAATGGGCDPTVSTGRAWPEGAPTALAEGAVGPDGAPRVVQGRGDASEVQLWEPGGDVVTTLIGDRGTGLGESVAVGDVTGDGVDDLVAGASRVGGVQVFAGPISGTRQPVEAAWGGWQPGGALGASVLLAELEPERTGLEVVVAGGPSVQAWSPRPDDTRGRRTELFDGPVRQLLRARPEAADRDVLVLLGSDGDVRVVRVTDAAPLPDTDTMPDTDLQVEAGAHLEVTGVTTLSADTPIAAVAVHPDADGTAGPDLLVASPDAASGAGQVWSVPLSAIVGEAVAVADIATGGWTGAEGDRLGAGLQVVSIDGEGAAQVLVSADQRAAPFDPGASACLDGSRDGPVWQAAGVVFALSVPVPSDASTVPSDDAIVLRGALDGSRTGVLREAVDHDGDLRPELRVVSPGLSGPTRDVLVDVCVP